MSDGRGGARSRWRHLIDPRLWVGIAFTVGGGWFALRGVNFGDVGRAMERANLLWLVVPSFLAYLWTLHLRALRWRHLAAGVFPLEVGPAYRATAIGFMVNNLLPLRMGELVRAWVLAREVEAPATAIFGTVVLERVVDLVFMVALAALVIGSQVNLQVLGLLALVPIAFVLALRLRPEPLLQLAHRTLSFALPEGPARRLELLLRDLAAGLAGIRSLGDLAWSTVYTVLIWAVASVIPFWAALQALGIQAGGLMESLRAALVVMVWVAAAVALPSAPGFLGTYQAAAKLGLGPLGVSDGVALALGILCWFVFWASFVVLGLLALRGQPGRLREALATVEGEGGSAPPAA